MSSKKRYYRNAWRSATVIFCIFLVYFIVITIIPTITTITVSNFPLGDAISENFFLALPLLLSIIPNFFVLGTVTTKARKNRIFKILFAGLVGYYLTVILCLTFFSQWNLFSSSGRTEFAVEFTSWTMINYSIFTLPMYITGMVILEYWTRRRPNKFAI
ncbi:MAG: hypothetical protein V2A54_08370 [Bacteroidota bacterium]